MARYAVLAIQASKALLISGQPITHARPRTAGHVGFQRKALKGAERLYGELVSTGGKETRQWARNMLGQALEKQNREAEAIPVYEQNVTEGSDTWHAHQRLAITYRRLGRTEDERRVLLASIQSVSSERGRQWCRHRLKKMMK